MSMRYLTQGEKENSRRLYECCFPEDSQKFVDYYYQEKCRENEIAVIEENGKIISMVHANPFTVSCCGTQAEVHYIVAVATDPEYRRRGYMRQLMQQVLRDCRNRGEVFSFLMPADPAYYEPLGYRYWNNQYVWEIPKEQELLLKGFCQNPEYQSDADPKALAQMADRILADQFDLYILRNASYYERIEKEQESEDGGVYVWYDEQKTPVGSVFYAKEDGFELREPILPDVRKQQIPDKDSLGKADLDKGNSDKDKLSVGERKDDSFYVTERKESVMMGRITDLPVFVQMLRSEKPYEEILQIRDDILPENNGIFRIYIDKTGGRAERAEACKNARAMDIATFGQLMFDRLRIFVNELV